MGDARRREGGDHPNRLQLLTVLICFAINIMDGFDVLAMAFAAPDVAREWGLSPSQVGLLLSAGLLGMALGALLLSPLGDLWGRRPTVIACVALVGTSMLASSFARHPVELGVARLLAGLGIGAVLTSTATLVLEYCPSRWRGVGMALMAAGFPLGAVAGGAAALALLEGYGWRGVFVAGGAGTLALLPLALLLLPESVDFLAVRRPPGALARINRIRARMAMAALDSLPSAARDDERMAIGDLLHGALLRRTSLLCAIFLLFMTSFYFILSWTPKMVAQAGLPQSQAVSTGLMLNLGGVFGALGAGALIFHLGERKVAVIAVAAMGVGVALMGLAVGRALPLGGVAAATGVAMFASMAGLYTLMLVSFPVGARVTGVGIVSTAGRVGSVLGPAAAGYLFSADASLEMTCAWLALPAFLAALLARRIGIEPPRAEPALREHAA